MLTDEKLFELFEEFDTPPAGRRFIQKARKEAPVRQVRSNSSNVITRYCSHKMMRVISTESRSVEFLAAIHHEFNTKVIEYYAQPADVDVALGPDSPGGKKRYQHCPDFLVISSEGFFLEEWKQEERLLKLQVKHPFRYKQVNGAWNSPELEYYFEKLGIKYLLRSSSELPHTFINNLMFLADYFDEDEPCVNQDTIETIRSCFNEEPYVSLAHLIKNSTSAVFPKERRRLNNGISMELANPNELNLESSLSTPSFTTDNLYKAIADGQIIVDLQTEELSDPQRVAIYRDELTFKIHRRTYLLAAQEEAEPLTLILKKGEHFVLDGVKLDISFVGDSIVYLESESGITKLPKKDIEALFQSHALKPIKQSIPKPWDTKAMDAVSPELHDIAIKRFEILNDETRGIQFPNHLQRTHRRWKAAIKNAGPDVLDQHLALIPKFKARGRRDRRISASMIEVIQWIAINIFNKPICLTIKASYDCFRMECTARNIEPCSLKTFSKELQKNRKDNLREGTRMAYQKAEIVWYLEFTEPIQGVRPFQYVHIDHTIADLLLRNPYNKELKKPWLSLAIDAATRAVLAIYLSFRSPSYRTCMMILRDIVRRHGRVPEFLVLDNGKDFVSRQMHRLCKLLRISIRYRPKGKPRFGAVIERLFGITNTDMIYRLQGNTQLLKHARMATKAVLPKNFAEWNLPGFWRALNYYFEHVYGETPHPAHGEPPETYLHQLLHDTGLRAGRYAHLNDTFLVESCPGPESGGDTRRIDKHNGVKIDSFYYQNSVFKQPGLDNTEIEVRVDPWDASIAYALIRGNWYRCISKLRSDTRTFTRAEVRALFEELKDRHKIRKSDVPVHIVNEWLRLLNSGYFNSKISAEMAEERTMCEELGLISSSHLGVKGDLDNPGELTSQSEILDPGSGRVEVPSLSMETADPSLNESADDQGGQDDGNYLF